MAKDLKDMTTEEIYKEPIKDILPLTIAANNLAGGANSGVNPYVLRNELILREQKKRIRYKNGFTLPASAEALQMDAERKVRHSRTLDRNIRKANPGMARPAQVDAHHIVAQQDWRAENARRLLYQWGIAINDADNGMYLPRYRSSSVPGLPNAPAHQIIHTALYFLAVTQVLSRQRHEPTEKGREALRAIKVELLAGTFLF